MKIPALVIFGFVLLVVGAGSIHKAYAGESEPTPTPVVGANEKIFEQNQNSPGQDRPRGIQSEASLSPAATGSPDLFGYFWDDSVAFSWKDPSGATQVFPISGSPVRNDFKGPFNLGFSFPYYEAAYSQLYISSEGFLSFVAGSLENDNRQIPSDTPPDNFIAPFWDDLVIGGTFNSGIVSYMPGSDTNGDYFAVNYLNVSRFETPSNLISFQVILYQNGYIWFQYNGMNGDLTKATVGIEDPDGVDGSLYLHNAPGIGNSLAIKFTRPGPGSRVKAWPINQSGFMTSGRKDFRIQIRNTGENGQDTYNLTPSFTGEGSSSWSVNLLNGVGNVPLTDTNNDGIVDSGPIGQGQTLTVTARLQAPDSEAVGDFSTFNLEAVSSNDPARQTTVKMQGEIPASFVRAFLDIAGGLEIERVLPKSLLSYNIVGSGNNPAIIYNGKGRYLFAWEDQDQNPGTDIEYALIDAGGGFTRPVTKLTDNSSASLPTLDLSPRIAASADGHIGIVWIRNIFDPGPPSGVNVNVFFAVLNPNGTVLLPPTDITENTDWTGDVDFEFPTITTTSSDEFLVLWVEENDDPAGLATDIWYALFNSDGTQDFAPDSLLLGVPGGIQYIDLVVENLPGDREAVGLSIFDPATVTYQVAYEVLDDIGGILQSVTPIPGVNGWRPDIAVFKDGPVLFSWTNPTSGEIEHIIFSDVGDTDPVLEIVPNLGTLTQHSNPDGRQADFVSVAVDQDGFGILSWMDSEFGQRLYYALVDQNGDVISPPIISRVGAETLTQPFVTTSKTGQGVALFPGINVFLPMTIR